VKAIWRYLAPISLLALCAPLASAQTAADVGIGFGSYHAKANASGIDNTTFGSCTPGSVDTCQSLPALSGLFMGFTGDVLITKKYGFGGEVSFQPIRTDYGPLKSRQLFFDANAIYVPLSGKRFSFRVEGGPGIARTSFVFPQSQCVGGAVCSSQNVPVGNSSHFQLHAGVGVSIYVTEHVFIRPQFDYHYVPGLNNQFGTNSVPGGTIWVGYSMGSRD